MRAYVVESVSPANFFNREWEGHVVQEIVRLLGGRTFYRIAIGRQYLDKALRHARRADCDIFHLSRHGNDMGVCLTNDDSVSWDELATAFERANYAPDALILSSCLGR